VTSAPRRAGRRRVWGAVQKGTEVRVQVSFSDLVSASKSGLKKTGREISTRSRTILDVKSLRKGFGGQVQNGSVAKPRKARRKREVLPTGRAGKKNSGTSKAPPEAAYAGSLGRREGGHGERAFRLAGGKIVELSSERRKRVRITAPVWQIKFATS